MHASKISSAAAAIGRPDLPDDVRAELVDGLYAPLGSLVIGAVAGIFVGIVVSLRTGDPWLAASTLALALVAAGRAALALAYRRRGTRAARDAAALRDWERRYAVGAWSYAACLGGLCFNGFWTSDDAATHLIVAAITTGYAAGVTARNAGLPRIAIGQLLLTIVPLALGAALHAEPVYLALAAITVLYLFATVEIALFLARNHLRLLLTTREKSELARSLVAQNLRFDAALGNMPHGLCMLDADRRLVVWNERFCDIYGMDRRVVRAGASIEELVAHNIELGHWASRPAGEIAAEYRARLDSGVPSRSITRLRNDRTIALSLQPMADGGAVVIFEDVTERERAEARMAHMARHDALTDLPNRTLMLETLSAWSSQLRPAGAGFAVLCLDLDRFKAVNDTLGHAIGDALLQAIAGRLRGLGGDAVIARVGGDEFVVLLPGAGAVRAIELGRTLIAALTAPYDLDGHQVDIGVSIGAALAPDHGDDPDELLKHADLALYRAKAEGRGTIRLFAADMDRRRQDRRQLESELRDAVATGAFVLLYQPRIDLATGQVTGLAALLHWRHPTRGLVPRANFAAVAEETGLSVPIGEWTLRQACRDAAAWPAASSVSVSLSPAQLWGGSITATIMQALAMSGLPPERLELEITEAAFRRDAESAIQVLKELRALGLRLAIDDFGAQQTSLGHLRAFPFDRIRIDRTLVADIGTGEASAAIVRAIAGLGASLGMAISADGVTTAEQLDAVRGGGCSEAQGPMLGPPLSAAEIAPLLARMAANPPADPLRATQPRAAPAGLKRATR
jgi:diguanylate cyclase (GGDEF)-like protein